MKNIVIVGSGPAGLTAAIYLARSGLKPVVITGEHPGGQLVYTDVIENYPGFESIKGSDLMIKMLSQAENLGSELIYENVETISKTDNEFFEIKLASGESILSKSVIITTGARHKHLGCPGENEYSAKGVSWCATCDGPMYRGKKVAVVGGGNTAVMEAIFLSNFADEVLLIHRRDSLRAEKFAQEKLFANTKIKCIWNSEVVRISGNASVEEIEIRDIITGTTKKQKMNGIFVAIGMSPVSEFAKNLVKMDDEGYIIANNTLTSCMGIFAAGDVVSDSLKQAIYAAGQGALAAKYAEEYLGIR